MSSEGVSPEVDFIESWLSNRRSESNFDSELLDLIETHRQGDGLDESGLLSSLMALGDKMEDEVDTD